MKRKNIHRLLITLLSLFLMTFTNASADDTDVYQSSVKSNAMLVIDTSGSMSWPVYDENEDYANFMRWMRDPNGDGNASDALAYDDGDSDPYGAEDALGCMDGNCWWDLDADATPNEYNRIDPNRIYLVSTYVEHNFIDYTDSGGTAQTASTIDDVMWNTGSETNSSYNKRHPMLSGGVFEVYNSSGAPWTMSDLTSIDTTTVNGEQHVVFPPDIRFISGTAPTDPNWNTVTNNYGNTLLPNAQDTVLLKQVTDPMSGVVTNNGFAGFLKSTGFYFSGLFERSSSPHYQFTDDRNNAMYNSGHRVYLFVTGNFLNFIKLVEDFKVDGMPLATYTYNLPYTYSGTQRTMAWRSVCDKSSVTGGGTNVWTEVNIADIQNQEYGSDYSSNRNETNGTIDLSAYGTPKSLKLHFSRLDVENYWTSGSCACWDTGSQNDGVILEDQDGNALTMVSSPDAGIEETAGGKLYGCDASGWTGVYDVDGVTSVTVKFYVASTGGDNCGTVDYGYRITRIQYSTFAPGDTVATGEPAFLCGNGTDGEGFKIKSRMDVAKNAMGHVIDETRDEITWGVTRFNGSDGGTVLSQLGTSVDSILAQIAGLNPGGSTPLGEATQDAYNSDYNYLDAHSALAACSNNYLVAMTDGFPTNDSGWSRINDSTASSYSDPTFGDCASGYGGCGSYGDADHWSFGGNANHMDDAAHWMYNEATYQHTVHSIAFGLDNPMLGDVADSSAGRYISAYNEQQVISAFYSLGLSMTASVAFTAPVVSVDEANRTQSGDKLYMAFFKPVNNDHWQGNLKKYGINYLARTDCSRTDPEWTVVDKDGFIAGNCDGSFKASSKSSWSNTSDGGKVDEGGVGELLKNKLDAISLVTGPYYSFRNINTYSGSAIVPFDAAHVSNTDLNVATDEERYKIINFMYGYTYATEANGDPSGKRNWVMGDMIHSEPRIIDYLDSSTGALVYRFVAIGANDGMLHVFLDSPDTATISAKSYSAGDEIFAFVPSDLLPNLKQFENTDVHPYMVDGSCNLFRATTTTGSYYDKTLVFGERRGGRSYWALDVTQPDPSLWTVKWHITGGAGNYAEMGYSWSKPFFGKLKTDSGPAKNIVVLSGGYDPLEDGFPETFDDDDHDGIWDSGENFTDTGGGTAGTYDPFNPGKDTMGRGIFVLDISDGSVLFKATYGDADNDEDETEDVTTGIDQKYCKMKYAFPADVSVIPFSESKIMMYAADIYGQIWKITYNYYGDMVHSYSDTDSTKWQVNRIFSANPGSSLAAHMYSGDADAFRAGGTLTSSDQGRKMFYSPDISYYGNCWTSKPVLYFGTGDRAHPRYAMISNRFYVVADHNTLTTENNLLNLTCDELDQQADSDGDGDVDADDTTKKDELIAVLKDESISRGFYRVMDRQSECSDEVDSHAGEQILSQPTVFFKNVYFTAYRPVFDDPCNPNGNSYVYAVDFCWGKSVFNYHDEGPSNPEVRNIRDTYLTIQNSSIPSGVRVITRGGHAAGLISAGGSVSGAGEDQSTNIPGPPGGVSQLLWETH